MRNFVCVQCGEHMSDLYWDGEGRCAWCTGKLAAPPRGAASAPARPPTLQRAAPPASRRVVPPLKQKRPRKKLTKHEKRARRAAGQSAPRAAVTPPRPLTCPRCAAAMRPLPAGFRTDHPEMGCDTCGARWRALSAEAIAALSLDSAPSATACPRCEAPLRSVSQTTPPTLVCAPCRRMLV